MKIARRFFERTEARKASTRKSPPEQKTQYLEEESNLQLQLAIKSDGNITMYFSNPAILEKVKAIAKEVKFKRVSNIQAIIQKNYPHS